MLEIKVKTILMHKISCGKTISNIAYRNKYLNYNEGQFGNI